MTLKTTGKGPDAAELADIIERYADDVIPLVVAALRGQATPEAIETAPVAGNQPGNEATAPAAKLVNIADQEEPIAWNQLDDPIEGFVAVWPAREAWKTQGNAQLREHYGPMTVYETHDAIGVARLAIGEPQERVPLYGKDDRGWVSVWEVVNGRPHRQLAVFVEVDDFETTGDRAALISGKDGAAKKGFAPNEKDLLPPVYQSMRIEVQRDRIVGSNSRNRLVVVANDHEVPVMLTHALAHLRLRG